MLSSTPYYCLLPFVKTQTAGTQFSSPPVVCVFTNNKLHQTIYYHEQLENLPCGIKTLLLVVGVITNNKKILIKNSIIFLMIQYMNNEVSSSSSEAVASSLLCATAFFPTQQNISLLSGFRRPFALSLELLKVF